MNQESSEPNFSNDKINIKNNKKIETPNNQNIDTGILPVPCYKPKVIYKRSYRVKKRTQANYKICAICGKTKTKINK